MYIEAESDLQQAIIRASEELSEQAMATPEEAVLIINAMNRALQVVLRYQQEQSSKG